MHVKNKEMRATCEAMGMRAESVNHNYHFWFELSGPSH